MPVLHGDAGTNVVWSGIVRLGRHRRGAEGRRPGREDRGAAFRPVLVDAPGVLGGAGRVRPRHGAVHAALQPPDAWVAAIWMGPALRVPLDQLRFVTQDIGGAFGNKITTHTYLTACCLLARKLKRPIQWTEWRTDQHTANAHGNERWFHDIEVAVQNDGTMLGFKVKALDDCGAFPRYEPLGCIIWAQVTPGLLPLAQHPRRLHPGRDKQVPGGAEPRLLADAAALADRADLRHRRARARPRPGRGAQAQLHQDRGDAVRDAERLRLRLRRLRALPGHRARPDRLRRRPRAPADREREADRHRDRLDARLGHEQLRPVDAAQPGAPVLGEQRGGDDQARHLRRDRR